MYPSVKKWVFDLLEVTAIEDFAGKIFNSLMALLIVSNVIVIILETVEPLYTEYRLYFDTFEHLSVIIFTLEYLLRLWTCNLEKRYEQPVLGRIRYLLTPMAIIDLAAIIPFYLPIILPIDLRIARSLRLFRLFRMFKLTRYSESMITFRNVLKAKKDDLLIAVFMVSILLIFASSLVYFVEREDQPEAFASIPAAMWWGVTTLTTVGYGDVYPHTTWGKMIGAFIAILGIGIFAFPAGLLASGFAEEIQKRRRRHRRSCPHCGMELDD